MFELFEFVFKFLFTLPLAIGITGGYIKATQEYGKLKMFAINLVTTAYIILVIWLWV